MRPAATVQHPGPLQEAQAKGEGAGQVQRAAHVDGVGQQGHRQQYQGVEQDVQLGVALAVGYRQHRDIGLGILLLAVNGQGPEVWRRPGEDDQHQQQGLGTDLATYCHPAKQRRGRACKATDNDVLRRRTLEKAGVEHRIAEQGGKRQPGGKGVGEHQ
ncbi:hypothetical protein D3C79_761200 [compost metagenome]